MNRAPGGRGELHRPCPGTRMFRSSGSPPHSTPQALRGQTASCRTAIRIRLGRHGRPHVRAGQLRNPARHDILRVPCRPYASGPAPAAEPVRQAKASSARRTRQDAPVRCRTGRQVHPQTARNRRCRDSLTVRRRRRRRARWQEAARAIGNVRMWSHVFMGALWRYRRKCTRPGPVSRLHPAPRSANTSCCAMIHYGAPGARSDRALDFYTDPDEVPLPRDGRGARRSLLAYLERGGNLNCSSRWTARCRPWSNRASTPHLAIATDDLWPWPRCSAKTRADPRPMPSPRSRGSISPIGQQRARVCVAVAFDR